MSNVYNVLGTIIFGGFLLNSIIPIITCMMLERQNNSEIDELVLFMGGKINRKWFFLNNIILLVALIVCSFLCLIFRNWVMFLICLPYFIILFILHWNNVYKRINAITNKHLFSLIFTIIFAIFCILSKNIYSVLEGTQYNSWLICLFIVIWLIIYIYPSKSTEEKEEENE